MGTFDSFQRKSPLASTPAISAPSLLGPSRQFAPLPPSQQDAPAKQAQPGRAKPLEYSFDRIPVFPPAKQNNSGLPDPLKTGVENLSGMSLADVQVHYHSSQPAQVEALAYTQGTDIYVGQGQEQHLAHEAWHVVQQKQGRVKPTRQAWGQAMNDDEGLEQEAESMGKKAASAANMTRVSHVKEAQDMMGHATRMLIPKTIQRVKGVAAHSDKNLVDVYIDLLLTKDFLKIHNLVTARDKLILVDSTDTQQTGYEPETNTLRVPMKTPDGADRPLPDIRAKILWEMHNALNRGAHQRTNAKFSIPELATPAGKELIPYHQAALALSAEWDEWIRIIELDLRVVAINQESGKNEDYVTRRYGEYFAKPKEGWYQFEGYLQVQIATGHTNSYDPYAQTPQWKGQRIVREVKAKYPNSLTITDKQVRDWREGKKAHIKESAINPFKTRTIIEAARFRDDSN